MVDGVAAVTGISSYRNVLEAVFAAASELTNNRTMPAVVVPVAWMLMRSMRDPPGFVSEVKAGAVHRMVIVPVPSRLVLAVEMVTDACRAFLVFCVKRSEHTQDVVEFRLMIDIL